MAQRTSAISYLWLKLTKPKISDYLSEGMGIEARASRSFRQWRAHLDSCKQFQRSALALLPNPPRTVAVLGAGRLLDFEAAPFLKKGCKLSLYDLDPGAAQSWKALRHQASRHGATIEGHEMDLSGTILGWTQRLSRALFGTRSANEAAAALRSLPPPVVPHLPAADVVISLNLLSQIPIYWRERVLALLARRQPSLLDESGEPVVEIEEALAEQACALQKSHLEMLRQLGAKLTVLITDVEFYYYRRDSAPWQVEPALYGLKLPPDLPGTIKLQDSWLWHIAPQGIEESDYGAIHKVMAFAASLE